MVRRTVFALLLTTMFPVAVLVTPTAANGRAAIDGRIAAETVLRVNVPEAIGGKTVIGQLTVDRPLGSGFVTAFGCATVPRRRCSSTRSLRSELRQREASRCVESPHRQGRRRR